MPDPDDVVRQQLRSLPLIADRSRSVDLDTVSVYKIVSAIIRYRIQ